MNTSYTATTYRQSNLYAMYFHAGPSQGQYHAYKKIKAAGTDKEQVALIPGDHSKIFEDLQYQYQQQYPQSNTLGN